MLLFYAPVVLLEILQSFSLRLSRRMLNQFVIFIQLGVSIFN